MTRAVLIQHPADGVLLINHALVPASTIGLPLARSITVAEGATFVGVSQAVNTQGPVAYSLSDADADFFNIDNNGQVAFRLPSSPRVFNVVVRVSDAFGSASQRLTITVVAVDPLPAIDPSGVVLVQQLPNAATLIRHQERLIFNVGVLPEGWSHVIVASVPTPFEDFVQIGDAIGYDTKATIGAFTTVITMDKNMNIAGTGDALEGSLFQIRVYSVANRFAFTTQRDIALGENEGPTLLPIPEQVRRFGEAIDIPLDGYVVDGDVNDASIISADLSALPWATFDADEIAITGIPPGPAIETVPITATDRLNNSVSSSFVLRLANDARPDPIVFADVEVSELNVMGVGSTVITGIDSQAPVTVEDGEWSADGINYTANPGFINNNDTLYLRRLSSDTNKTTVTVRVNVGGEVGLLNIITAKLTAKLVLDANRRDEGSIVPMSEGESVTLYVLESGTDTVVVPRQRYVVDSQSRIEVNGVDLTLGRVYDCPIADETSLDSWFLRNEIAVSV